MPPLGHSPVGASSCERWWNCPGSNALIAKLPPAAPTKYAAEGTVAHALCEKYLKNKIHFNCKWNAEGLIGEVLEADDFKFTVNEEMAAAANLYVDTIMEDAARIGCNLRRNVQLSGDNQEAWRHWDKETQEQIFPCWTNIEKDFELKDVDSEARGTNDASIFVPGETLIVYDFKYGAGVPVEAVENKQMMYYAIGAAGDKLMEFKTIELVIVQPRAEHPQGPVRRWVTTPQVIAQFKKDLKEHIAQTRNPEAETKTGKWCRWCNAKMICPAMRDKAYEIAKVDFAAPVQNNVIRPPEQLTKEQLKLFLDNMDLFENYINDVRTYAFNLLNAGGTIEGYKLVRSGKAHRKWNAEESQIAPMLELELGLGHEQIYDTKLKTPAQIEKLFKGPKKSVDNAKDILKAYWYKPEGELKLAREDDIREKQTPAAIADFSELGL